MQQPAVHLGAIFMNGASGNFHVQVRVNGNVVFNDTLGEGGAFEEMDVTEPIDDPVHIEVGIIRDDGAFHAVPYADAQTFGGPPQFDLVIPDGAGGFPDSPAGFDPFELFVEQSSV